AGGAAVRGGAAFTASTGIAGTGTFRASSLASGGAAIPGTGVYPSSEWPSSSPVTGGTAAVRARQTIRRTAVPGGIATARLSASRPSAGRARGKPASRGTSAAPRPRLAQPAARYQAELPPAVATAYFTSAKTPLARAQPLYRDVAGQTSIPWQVLAACDWMQCQSNPRFSPVHGERIGMPNPDGTVYST